MNPVIVSLLQNDAYKFSMGQWIFHQHNGKQVRWAFKCRNKDVVFTEEMIQEIESQIAHYCSLRFTEEELSWLKDNMIWIHQDYLDFLKFWHPDSADIMLERDNTPGSCGLKLEFEGSATNVSMYETPIMAIICEVYYRYGGAGRSYEGVMTDYCANVAEQVNKINSGELEIAPFSEFGFRRALSQEAHEWMIAYLKEHLPGEFLGTSNVYLAKKFNVKPMGTMAHEAVMLVGQGYPDRNPAYSNQFMMESWVKEYGILNGIMLTDTIGTDVFLKDFRLTFATLFSGVRHDSGNPYKWGDKMINHYESLGIDPMTKTLLFSDSLSIEKAADIYNYFKGRAKVAFGIGGAWASPKGEELNIVIKPIEVDGQPVAKISDAPGKNMCKDPEYVEYLNRTINWRLLH